MHSHPNSVVVFLNDGMVKFTFPDGKTQDASGKAGDAQFTPAQTHNPENVGTGPVDGIRSRIPNFFTRFGCGKRQVGRITAAGGDPTKNPCYGEIWQRNPWNAFVSLKFAPSSSNPIKGYVLGGSFSIAHYMDFLVGFALTPVSEPSPGFRVVASQFVTAEQKQGLDMSFNPTAMLNNSSNAFDGFPTNNPTTGALIYAGNPLTTHYRGGVVLGVSVPIAFSAFLKGGSATPPAPSSTTPAPGTKPAAPQ